MNEIVDSVRRVTDIMAEISAANTEQTSGIEQVNHAITQMDEATQKNAALVEEAAAASQALHDQVVNLTTIVSIFKLDNGGLQGNLSSASLKPVSLKSPALTGRNKPTAKPLLTSEKKENCFGDIARRRLGRILKSAMQRRTNEGGSVQ